MSELSSMKCEPCRGGIPPLKGEDIRPLFELLEPGWEVVDEHHLTKTWSFPDFATALAFVNAIGDIAEDAGHHPDVHLAWGRVRVDLWTHKIDGLHLADFVVAARIDEARAA